MRLRTLGAAAAAVLAAATLAGCRTNVGVAARVDGHRITESDVNGYLTPNAQPVSVSETGGVQLPPRAFVLEQLLDERLGLKLLERVPAESRLTSKQLDAQLDRDLQGRSEKSVAEQGGLKGYTKSFYRIVLRVREISIRLQTVQQQGGDVRQLINALKVPVWVSPRYGKWDRSTLSIDGTGGLPSFLELQSSDVGGQANAPAS